MLLQKRKHFLESSLFSMALSQLEKRKHSVLSLVKIKTKLSKNFPFAMKFGIFGNSNTQRWYVFWFGCFWTLFGSLFAMLRQFNFNSNLPGTMMSWNCLFSLLIFSTSINVADLGIPKTNNNLVSMIVTECQAIGI